MSYEIPTQFCPNCYTVLDAASNYPDDTYTPAPGDFTVCIECGAILAYDACMYVHLKKLSDAPLYLRPKLAWLVMMIHEKKEHSKRWI